MLKMTLTGNTHNQHGFKRQNLLYEHLERGCLAVEGQSVKLPRKGDDDIEFRNIARAFECPSVVYGDFASLTEKVKSDKQHESNATYIDKYLVYMIRLDIRDPDMIIL